MTSLPEVLPPFGFYERMLLDPSGGRARRRARATRIGVVGLAATASIWLGVLALSGLDGRRPSGVPALNSLVSLHDQSQSQTRHDDRPGRGDGTGHEPRAARRTSTTTSSPT